MALPKARTAPLPPGAPAAIEEIHEQVGQLVQRHQAELNSCLEGWLQRAQAEAAWKRAGRAEAQPLHQVTLPAVHHTWSEKTLELPPISLQDADAMQQGAAANLPGTVETTTSGHLRAGTRLVLPPGREQVSNFLGVEALVSSQPSGPRHGDTTVFAVASAKRRRKAQRRSTEYLMRAQQTSAIESRTLLERITLSRQYEVFSGMLIFLNAIFIGWQTQHMASQAELDAANNRPLQVHTGTAFLVLQSAFSVLFSVELGLRWVCKGLIGFFLNDDMWWNILDVFIVVFSVLDLLLSIAVESSSRSEVLGNITVLRVLRVVRVVRIARVIRIMKFFRELRMMIFSILGSMKSLVWVILVLTMTFYVFGITFTAATTSALDTADKWRAPATQELITHFGSMDRSILSLFMAMSGGQDWGLFYDALRELPMQYRILFLLYITFAVFAVVNIVTGVFVESAMQLHHADREVIVHEELESKKTYLRSMKEVFDELDEDGTGLITLQEFESKLNDERVIAYFNALKLDVSDARTLFKLLDYDQSSEVDIDEFLTGCYRLQGDARSLDMKIMQCEVRYLQESFTLFWQTLQEIQKTLNGRSAHARPGTSLLDWTAEGKAKPREGFIR